MLGRRNTGKSFWAGGQIDDFEGMRATTSATMKDLLVIPAHLEDSVPELFQAVTS